MVKTNQVKKILEENSPFLARFVSHHPKLFPHLESPAFLKKTKKVSTMVKEIKSFNPKESLRKNLRLYKYRELVRITVRDLLGLSSFETTGKEISDLATACLEVALQTSFKKIPLCVLGLGKLGGEDLNFSSDIDILYICDPRDQELIPQWTQGAEKLTQLLQERTEDGFVFRVDLNLRPEGKNGPLVCTLDYLSSYYEISGSPWERVAWIKARPIAGKKSLGEKALHLLNPFVYPKTIDFAAIGHLKEMKQKIEAELRQVGSKTYNVKLGKGGIREIEFFVSAFQLIYGGKEPHLQERNTLEALSLLKKFKLVPEKEAVRLRDAYIFLRRIENRLQMVEERQTHHLPQKPEDLKRLSHGMGFDDPEIFLGELKKKTDFVAQCFERLAP